jgi:benzylsuccinate CoA-transferase BbsF subunit
VEDAAMTDNQVFRGLKVADFAWAATGPMVSRTLAEHGAIVVHVESHNRFTVSRLTQPFKDGLPGIDRSAHGARLNTNKYGMSLDLTLPQGRKVAKRLIAWADVVTESFRPGTMKKWCLDYEAARAVNPGVIYFSTSMQGQSGPHALFGAYGAQLTCLSGFSWPTGRPDREPVVLYGAYTDWVSAPHLTIAVIGALLRRRKTGRGMYLDQSQYESGVQFLAPAILDYQVNGRVAGRRANRDDHAAPHGAYRCQGDNRWVVIAVCSDQQWLAFGRALGGPEWTTDPALATLAGRKAREDELDQRVGAWTIQHSPEAVMELLQRHGIPAGVVQHSGDLFSDPQLQHRQHSVPLEHREIGTHAYPNESMRFSKTPPRFWKAGPCLGEDNEYVYRDLLGYSEDEISDLMAEGVITFETGEEFSAPL